MADNRLQFIEDRQIAQVDWLTRNYDSTGGLSLVFGSQSALEVFSPNSVHTVFYQPLQPNSNVFVSSQIDYFADQGLQFCDYEEIQDLRTFKDARESLSFATGTVLEPPFYQDTFDNVYFDFWFAQLSPSPGGYEPKQDFMFTLIAMAEYLEKAKVDGNFFFRAPIANEGSIDGVVSEFSKGIEQLFGSEVLEREVVITETGDLQGYDLLMKVKKLKEFDAKNVREQLKLYHSVMTGLSGS